MPCSMHQAMPPLVDFQGGNQPEATYDMSDILHGQAASAKRRFIKEGNRSVMIEDVIEPNDSTGSITWGFMTLADVQPTDDGAILHQDGKELKLKIVQPENLNVSIICLDPPPMEIDKTIEGLKRIEIRIPDYILKETQGEIRVRLSMKENE